VLTVARSLKRCGVSVALVHSGSAAAISRVFNQTFRVPPPEHDFAAYAAAVLSALQGQGSPLLILSSDSALRLVADHGAALAACGTLATPPASAVRAVLDKHETMRIARECGVPVPATYDVSDLAALNRIRPTLSFPLIVKPRSKAGRPARFKVKYLDTFDELEREFENDVYFGDDYLIQDRVNGDGVGIGVFLEGGNPIAFSQHRRIKELPPTGGVAVTAVSEPVDPVLADYSVRLLRAMGWSGVAMVEFKRSATGRIALMEVNGRFWGTIALAVDAGIDFPRYLWQSATRAALSVSDAPPRRAKFCWSSGELSRIGELVTAGGARPTYIIGQIAAACVNLVTPSGHPIFRASDPMPAFVETSRVVWTLTRQAVRSTIRRLVPKALVEAVKASRDLRPPARRVYLSRLALRALGARGRRPAGPLRAVLFVCHGNIMRSAYAEAYARSRFESGGVAVWSAGVQAKQGRGADARAIEVAARRGVSLERHTATLLNADLVNRADLIIVMDFRNEARVLAEYPVARGRVALLGSFASDNGFVAEVKDPYGTPEAEIDRCFDEVAQYVDRLGDHYGLRASGSRLS
jgi:predicted ATP-grasp superfamily ATP-dependent carboligase/protein-tyrosine-phosphatase